jgi:pectate disaccharide-lyase
MLHSLAILFLVVTGPHWRGAAQSTGADQLFNISAQFAGGPIDYYVRPDGSDSNDGSVSHPFHTIQHAADLVAPGTTVHVAPGLYSEAVTINASGTGTERIRFVSDEKWGAKLLANGASGIWSNYGSYVDIEGFEISGNSNQGILNYGSFVRLLNNYVHDIQTDCSSGGSGINHANYSASDNDTVGNVVRNIAALPGCKSDHGPGIYHSNLRGAIVNNTVSYAREGIHLWHAADAVTISGNVLLHNRAAGILVGAGDAPGGVTADHCIVTGNTSAYNRLGIREFGKTGTNNEYINNKVYANAVNWLLQNGNSPK